jgi:hypothetical protein
MCDDGTFLSETDETHYHLKICNNVIYVRNHAAKGRRITYSVFINT